MVVVQRELDLLKSLFEVSDIDITLDLELELVSLLLQLKKLGLDLIGSLLRLFEIFRDLDLLLLLLVELLSQRCLLLLALLAVLLRLEDEVFDRSFLLLDGLLDALFDVFQLLLESVVFRLHETIGFLGELHEDGLESDERAVPSVLGRTQVLLLLLALRLSRGLKLLGLLLFYGAHFCYFD